MKKLFVLACISLSVLACATSPLAINKIAASGGGDLASVVAAEGKTFDPLAKVLTSPKFVQHANASLALAGTSDPIFTQCVQFGLNLGEELKANPIITAPSLHVVTADLTCPLCVLEAKRQDVAELESGKLAADLNAVHVRLRDIHKRLALACGPLYMDELDVLGHATSLFGGLL